jgi:hypothetical protein
MTGIGKKMKASIKTNFLIPLDFILISPLLEPKQPKKPFWSKDLFFRTLRAHPSGRLGYIIPLEILGPVHPKYEQIFRYHFKRMYHSL